MSDKDELLKSNVERLQTIHNLNLKHLLTAYALLLLLLLIAIPKIYFSNEIYYASRDIAELKTRLNILTEENKLLKQRLEVIRYKNQIIDNMSN